MNTLNLMRTVIFLWTFATAAHAGPRTRVVGGSEVKTSDVKTSYEKAKRIATGARDSSRPKTPIYLDVTGLRSTSKRGTRYVMWDTAMREIKLGKTFKPTGDEAHAGFLKASEEVIFRVRSDGGIERRATEIYFTGTSDFAPTHTIYYVEETLLAANGVTNVTVNLDFKIHGAGLNDPDVVGLTRLNDGPIVASPNFTYGGARASLKSDIAPILAIVDGIGAPMASAFRSALHAPLPR